MLSADDYLKFFHEIKNSITLINSSLQLISKEHPEVASYELWGDTMSEIKYLRAMIIEFSKSGVCTSINIEPTSMSIFLKDLIHSIDHFSPDTNFHCEANISGRIPILNVDSMRLKQAIMNLIKNSFEAMNQTGTIQLNAFVREKSFILEIVDHGGGLKNGTENSLYQLFFTTKPDGTGLGLPITKQIIELHNGYLLCDNRPNDGCTFTICLPIEN